MNTNTALERMLASVMTDEAMGGDQDPAIDKILSLTGRTRPLPRWLVFLKEPPMRLSTTATTGSATLRRVVVALMAILLVILAAGAIVAGSSLLAPKTPSLMPLAPGWVLTAENRARTAAPAAVGARTPRRGRCR